MCPSTNDEHAHRRARIRRNRRWRGDDVLFHHRDGPDPAPKTRVVPRLCQHPVRRESGVDLYPLVRPLTLRDCVIAPTRPVSEQARV